MQFISIVQKPATIFNSHSSESGGKKKKNMEKRYTQMLASQIYLTSRLCIKFDQLKEPTSILYNEDERTEASRMLQKLGHTPAIELVLDYLDVDRSNYLEFNTAQSLCDYIVTCKVIRAVLICDSSIAYALVGNNGDMSVYTIYSINDPTVMNSFNVFPSLFNRISSLRFSHYGLIRMEEPEPVKEELVEPVESIIISIKDEEVVSVAIEPPQKRAKSAGTKKKNQ